MCLHEMDAAAMGTHRPVGDEQCAQPAAVEKLHLFEIEHKFLHFFRLAKHEEFRLKFARDALIDLALVDGEDSGAVFFLYIKFHG